MQRMFILSLSPPLMYQVLAISHSCLDSFLLVEIKNDYLCWQRWGITLYNGTDDPVDNTSQHNQWMKTKTSNPKLTSLEAMLPLTIEAWSPAGGELGPESELLLQSTTQNKQTGSVRNITHSHSCDGKYQGRILTSNTWYCYHWKIEVYPPPSSPPNSIFKDTLSKTRPL